MTDNGNGHYFFDKEGGMFVLQRLGNMFVVATAGVNTDDSMADLYTRSVRKAASFLGAVAIINKMVR